MYMYRKSQSHTISNHHVPVLMFPPLSCRNVLQEQLAFLALGQRKVPSDARFTPGAPQLSMGALQLDCPIPLQNSSLSLLKS